MEPSRMDEREPRTPCPPIVVLSSRRVYITVSSTVAEAVEVTRDDLGMIPRLSLDEGTGDDRRPLALDELDFFDRDGRRLLPISESGQLRNLAVVDDREEIRERVRRMFDKIRPDAEKEKARYREFDDQPLLIADGEPFVWEEFVRQLEEDLDLDGAVTFPTSHGVVTFGSWLHAVLWS